MLETIATTPSSNDRFSQGCERFAAVAGFPAKVFLDNLKDSSPEFGQYLIEWVFGDVYARGDLDLKTRELAIIAAGAVLGATGIDVLRFHIPNAIRAGATHEQIFGILIQVAVIAGVPTALAAITEAGRILADKEGAAE